MICTSTYPSFSLKERGLGGGLQAAGALMNLTLNSDNQTAATKAGAIDPLLELINSTAPMEGKALAAGTLRNLALNTDSQVGYWGLEFSNRLDTNLFSSGVAKFMAVKVNCGWIAKHHCKNFLPSRSALRLWRVSWVPRTVR